MQMPQLRRLSAMIDTMLEIGQWYLLSVVLLFIIELSIMLAYIVVSGQVLFCHYIMGHDMPTYQLHWRHRWPTQWGIREPISFLNIIYNVSYVGKISSAMIVTWPISVPAGVMWLVGRKIRAKHLRKKG